MTFSCFPKVPDSPTELKVLNITDTKALLVWKPSQAKVDSYILSYGSSKCKSGALDWPVPHYHDFSSVFFFCFIAPNVTVTVTLSGNTVEHQLRSLQRSSLYVVKITSQVSRLQSSPVSTTFTTGSGA